MPGETLDRVLRKVRIVRNDREGYPLLAERVREAADLFGPECHGVCLTQQGVTVRIDEATDMVCIGHDDEVGARLRDQTLRFGTKP